MGKTIVITGASDGIGAEAARILAGAGHQVIPVGRNPAKVAAVAASIGARHFFAADFEELDQVLALARDLRECCPRIDVLANNAGGIFDGPVRTVDGFERTFQVNHLAPFLLTHQLMGVLVASRAAVVCTSSLGARLFGHIDVDDMDTWRGFSPAHAYGNAKLANILFAAGLHRRYFDAGLSAVSFHPGTIATNFAYGTSTAFARVYHSALRVVLKPVRKGGENLAYFAQGSPGAAWESGCFYGANRRIGRTSPQAASAALIEQHWQRSAAMLGIKER